MSLAANVVMTDQLPAGVIHSDANDYNVIVTGTGFDARVSSVIDFGDAVH